jgi:hypothetical protein
MHMLAQTGTLSVLVRKSLVLLLLCLAGLIDVCTAPAGSLLPMTWVSLAADITVTSEPSVSSLGTAALITAFHLLRINSIAVV